MKGEITIENCEQAIKETLETYQEKNLMNDFWFWRCVLPLLKKKWSGKAKGDSK